MVFFAHPSPPEVVMAWRGRSAALILAALTVCPGMILCFYLPRTEAEPRPSPFRTAQITSPLSPVPMPDHPPVEALGPPTELPSPPGTTCPIDPPTPVVSLRIRVMDSAAVGQPLEYHICLRNESCAPAYHVQVRNPLPAHARFLRATPEPSTREPELLWHLGTLRPQTCSEIILVLEPTGTGDVRNCARVQFEHGQCVTTRIARPRLSLSKTGPSEASQRRADLSPDRDQPGRRRGERYRSDRHSRCGFAVRPPRFGGAGQQAPFDLETGIAAGWPEPNGGLPGGGQGHRTTGTRAEATAGGCAMRQLIVSGWGKPTWNCC